MTHSTLTRLAALPLCATLILAASPALAQQNTTTYVPKDEIKQNEAEAALSTGRIDGTLGVTASFSLASNQNVVGQVDGFSTLVGLGLVGGLDYLRGKYEMRNTLQLNESFARTPVVPEFLKTNDILQVENLHNYFLLSWAGVFGRLSATTNIFDTEDVRTEQNTYVLNNPEPGQETVLATDADRFTLNKPLSPLTLNQSIGVFAEPVRKQPVTLSVRLGGGGRQTFADGVLVLDDNADTAEIEVQQLSTVLQAGAEAFVGAKGSTKDKRATYDVGVSVMVPFINNDDRNRSAGELTRIAAESNITFGIFEWLNMVYSARVINDPQLLDEWQVQNNLLLTFQYTLIERSQAKPTDPDEIAKAQAAAAAAEKKAAEAEQKAKEAEEKAAEAEQKAKEAEQKAKEAEQKAREAGAQIAPSDTDTVPEPATDPVDPPAPE